MSDVPRPRPLLRGAIASAAVLGLAVGGVLAVDQQRQTASAREADVLAARGALAAELAPLHADLHGAAHTARQDLASTRLLVAELLAGGDRDVASVHRDLDARVDRLRASATTLEVTARGTVPSVPADLPQDEAEPVARSMTDATELSDALAQELHARTDDLETRVAGAAVLADVFQELAGGAALPEGDDADEWAAAWREEADRLAALRDDVADLLTDPALGPLAAAQLALLHELDRLASDAAAALEADDIDGHNARVAELDEERVALLTDGVERALTSTLTALTVPLELTEDAATGTTHALEELRQHAQVPALTDEGDGTA